MTFFMTQWGKISIRLYLLILYVFQILKILRHQSHHYILPNLISLGEHDCYDMVRLVNDSFLSYLIESHFLVLTSFLDIYIYRQIDRQNMFGTRSNSKSGQNMTVPSFDLEQSFKMTLAMKHGWYTLNLYFGHFLSSVLPNLVATQGHSIRMDPSSKGYGMRFESKPMNIFQTRVHACTLPRMIILPYGQVNQSDVKTEMNLKNLSNKACGHQLVGHKMSEPLHDEVQSESNAVKSSYIEITTYKLANHFSH